jgi:hypothetical protein
MQNELGFVTCVHLKGTPGNGVPIVIGAAQQIPITGEQTTANGVPIVSHVPNDHSLSGSLMLMHKRYISIRLVYRG